MAYDQKSVVSLGFTSVFRPALDAQECHEKERNLGRVVKREGGKGRERGREGGYFLFQNIVIII